MILFLFALEARRSNQIIEYDKNYIKQELKKGKKMSDLVDLEFYKKEYPETAEFIEIMERIDMPKSNCMSEVLQRLNFNCDSLSEDERKKLSLAFTQCYFKLTNREDDFPFNEPEEDQIRKMKPSTYNIFQILTLHVSNMCNFARLAAFDAYNSESLVDLFESVITATELLNETDKDIGNQVIDLTQQINEIREKLAQGNVSLALLNRSLIIFKNRIGPIAESGRSALETIEKVKLYVVVILCTFIIAHFLPEVLFIILPLTVFVYFGDNKLSKLYSSAWENSVWRTLGKTLYLTICLSYPCYILALTIYQSLLSFVQLFAKRKHSVKVVSFAGGKRKK